MVIRRDSADDASVRTVAEEAGWSPGALRHYCATHSEPLAFAMRLAVERIEGRIAAPDRATDPRQAVEQRLFDAPARRRATRGERGVAGLHRARAD